MTEAQLQAAVHTLYEGDTNTPEATSEDYLARRGLLNAGINIWENYGNTYWNELYKTSAASTGGTLTTTATTSAYDCPTNFLNVNGYLRIIDAAGDATYYSQIQPNKVQLFDNQSSTPNYFYVTGSPSSGYSVNIHPTPTVSSLTIRYEYYATSTSLSAITSVPECSDPYFLVYFALSRMYHIDGLSGKANEALGVAEGKLMAMRKRNGMLSHYQSNSVVDIIFDQGVQGFGL